MIGLVNIPANSSVSAMTRDVLSIFGMCLTLTAVGLTGCATSHRSTVQVPATVDWQATGITVQPGDRVRIEARGTWSHGHEGYLGYAPHYGPDGYDKSDSTVLMATVNVGTLIGRIGQSAPFAVGRGIEFKSMFHGELFVGMNEQRGPHPHENNKGQLVATIQVTRLAQ